MRDMCVVLFLHRSVYTNSAQSYYFFLIYASKNAESLLSVLFLCVFMKVAAYFFHTTLVAFGVAGLASVATMQ